jgi:predicted nucleic acid-binding protein
VVILDTDVMVDFLSQYPPTMNWLNSIGVEQIFLPGFVVMELINGTKNKIEQRQLERKLESYEIVWPTSEACDEALLIFSRYHLSHGIGILDALIGQTAVSLNLPLYTFNQKHYDIIPNLRTVQPYEKIFKSI